MTASLDRLHIMRDVTAMVALDTIDLLAERVRHLLSHGRRITMTQRYTWVDSPPEVTTGLTMDGEPKSWRQDGGAGFAVRLKPGVLTEFGFSCYASDGNATEAEAWKRFHAAQSLSDNWSERRRDMTSVHINGGLPGDGPARDDLLVIRHWNRDGICDERVIAFDHETSIWNGDTPQ